MNAGFASPHHNTRTAHSSNAASLSPFTVRDTNEIDNLLQYFTLCNKGGRVL